MFLILLSIETALQMLCANDKGHISFLTCQGMCDFRLSPNTLLLLLSHHFHLAVSFQVFYPLYLLFKPFRFDISHDFFLH